MKLCGVPSGVTCFDLNFPFRSERLHYFEWMKPFPGGNGRYQEKQDVVMS